MKETVEVSEEKDFGPTWNFFWFHNTLILVTSVTLHSGVAEQVILWEKILYNPTSSSHTNLNQIKIYKFDSYLMNLQHC